MIAFAHSGTRRNGDDGEPMTEGPEVTRARCTMAHRVWMAGVLRLVASGGDADDAPEPSVDAEAGALLEAETACALWRIDQRDAARLEAGV